MAKKKTSPPPTPPESGKAQRSVINLKGSDEYIAWLEAANSKTRLAKATMFRMGMEMFAKAHGLEAPPEM